MDGQWTKHLRGGLTQHWPLRTSICCILGLLLVAGWAMAHRQVKSEEAEAERSAISQAQNRAIALEQYVVRTLEAADLVTLHLGYKYFIHRDLPPSAATGARPQRISDPIVDRQLFAGAHAVNVEGDLVATTLARLGRTNVSYHPIFQDHLRKSSTSLEISSPLPSRFIPGRHVHASRRIIGNNGETLGFVDLQMSPEQLLNFPVQARFKPTDLVSVISLDGITLARREGAKVSAGQDLRGSLVMLMQQQNPNGTYVGPSSLDGHVRYFSHRRLAEFPLFVTAGVSRSEALAPVHARALFYYGGMTALTAAGLLITLLTLASLSARQKRERALSEANRRLAEAQRVAKIGAWELDIKSGQVTWSDPLCEMYERDDSCVVLTVEEFSKYLDQAGEETVRKGLSRAIATGEAQSYEIRVTLPSGTVSDRRVILVPVRGPDGQISSVHGTDQDVTQEKLLHAMEAQLAFIGRQDSMSIMASTLAHELNQPLAAASNYLVGSERLAQLDETPQSQKLRTGLAAAREQIHSAAEIIRRVREMLRRHHDLDERSSLKEAAQSAVSLLELGGIAEKGSIETLMDPRVDAVRANQVQLQQVLVNLLRNACEATANRTDARVSLRSFAETDAFVRIEVADNGPGLSRAAHDIFTPSPSDKPQGLGLGLSISRTIIEYHGGRLWVAETGAEGTTIAFTVPSAEHQGAPGEH